MERAYRWITGLEVCVELISADEGFVEEYFGETIRLDASAGRT